MFAARHVAGIGLFVWLALAARRLDPGGPWILVAAFTVAYAAVAVWAGLRLYRQEYRRRRPGH